MTAPAAAPAAFRDARVLRWLAAYTCSVTGDVAYFMALSWAVARAAGPAQVGAVVAVGALPRAVLMLGGGVLADRWGPRRVLIGSDLVRAVVVLAVAALTAGAGPRLWPLCGLALVFGSVDAVFMPAVGALPVRLTSPDQLARVQGLRSLAVRLSNAVGPLLAGVALSTGGAAMAFTVSGTLFALSLAFLLALRIAPLAAAGAPGATGASVGAGGRAGAGEDGAASTAAVAEGEAREQAAGPRAPRPTAWADLRAGLRRLRSRPRLLMLVIVVALGDMCFSGPVATGLVLLTTGRGWPPAALGWILTAFSVGGAVTGLSLAVAPRVPGAGPVMAAALLVAAAAITAVGRAPTAAAAVVLGGALGAASGVASGLGNALVQRETEPAYQGRITAVTTLCTLGVSPLLLPVTGLVAAAWGPGALFAGFGAVCLTAAVLACTPVLRGIRLPGTGTETP
ncbi:MFS transporter [Streptomyces sp. TS71-3]|uniref:MFS transporter n=1 Tax=Streptomyces sp. TS71-3 TaxID=2733862 RepID=UPI001BB3E9F4|nr:MFS transporter [Streptomyces sp. TS71-3]